MYKRDDYVRNKPDGVFSRWQGFARSMLLPKPFSETAELRRTVADYSLISRGLAPKILTGAKGNREDLRVGKDFVGSRYRVQEPIQGLGVAVNIHDADDISHGQTESFRTRLRSYGRPVPLLKKLGDNASQTITQKKTGGRSKDKKHGFEEERDVSCVEPEENNNTNSRHDDIVDGSDSASVCGVLQEDGTTCLTAPVTGRKRCTEHRGQRISCVHSVKKPPCEEETEEICGVILPEMVRCRSKPVSGRKRCEDHKGMRVNAFFFLLNPTDRDKILKEDNKSKPETLTSSMNQEEPGESHSCEATTKNGLPCTRSAPNGSKRCWQHKDETVDQKSSENVQTSTTVCGVKLHNGSVCEKTPVKGRKRCQEHKGMRITS
ncbi:BnaA01g35250D [Brassica napus]|uniref:BnaA01g35250D protein n=1 Tax=Brassica napus TaxID=3708 RepID=A0A078JPU5_BRANA|nr:BnaA01g35250D [Brassica napus]